MKKLLTQIAILGLLLIPSASLAAYSITKSPLLVAATPSYFLTASNPANLNITGDITIEAWVKFTSMPSDRANLVGKPNAAGTGYSTYNFELEKNGANYDLRLVMDSGGVFAVDYLSWNPSTNVWYHVAVTRVSSSGAYKFYVDGVEVASGTGTSGNTTGDTSAVYLGRFGDGTPLQLDGRLSLVRIWNTVRTGIQINDNKCNVFGTATTNMQAEWSLDDVLTDASGNGYTLTNVNSVAFAVDTPSLCASAAAPAFQLWTLSLF